MSWNVKKREEMIIQKKDAEELLKLNTYGAQRPLNQKKLSHLVWVLKNEYFRTGEVAIAIIKDDNGKKTKVLVNGQHQLHAVVEVDDTIIVMYEEIECDTWEDVAFVYGTFDQGGRGYGDLLAPYADAYDIDWPPRFTKLVSSGGLFKDGRINWDRTKKVAALHEYVKPGEFVYSIFSANGNGKLAWKECKHLARRSVVAAVMATWEKHKEQAKIFWIKVKDGDDCKKGDPAMVLRDFLRDTSVDTGRGSQYSKKATEKEVYKKCIVAWNAHRRGDPTQLKIYNGTIPKII